MDDIFEIVFFLNSDVHLNGKKRQRPDQNQSNNERHNAKFKWKTRTIGQ